MSPSEESTRTGLPRFPVSLARAAAPWKRSANASTIVPEATTLVSGWRPESEQLAAYRSIVASPAQLPLAYPQVPIMALHIDLLSRWSFPIKAMGMVHLGTVIDVLDELPLHEPWDVRATVSGGRHVRSGLEFDLTGEILVDGRTCWRSTAITLSRSRSAAGGEDSTVPRHEGAGEWASESVIPVSEGTGRAFGRVTGDVNPIHLHAVSARLFGFKRAIAHGWWTTGRCAAALDADEAVAGRRLEIAFRRPVLLPSAPILCSRPGSPDGVEFALFPVAPTGDADEPVRALASGVVTG